MRNRFVEILTCLLFLLTSCSNAGDKSPTQAISTETNTTQKDSFEKTEIICDSIYMDEKYKIVVSNFSNETSYDPSDFNAIFRFYGMKNGEYQELYKDSIQRHFNEIKFKDFNNDHVKDILIENISDARSNLTYYLYLVDTLHNRLEKIKRFETIKNPNYLPKYSLIDNMVMSGRNWTSFYKINADSIKDFEFVIYDGENENGKVTYEKDCNIALNKILSTEKNNR